MGIKHSSTADGSFSGTGATNWNADHTIDGDLDFGGFSLTNVGRLVVSAGTLTTDVPIASFTGTWNNSGVTFEGLDLQITDTASAAGSLAARIRAGVSGATRLLELDKSGNLVVADGARLSRQAGVGGLVFTSSGPVQQNGYELVSGGATSNAIASSRILKSTTGIADNVATSTVTFTVGNAATSASAKVMIRGSLGAGGAVGASEAAGTITYDIAIARRAGLATVATISSGYGAASSSVAGAATIAVTAALSGLTGADSASQTFTLQVTIACGSGSSTNHTAHVLVDIINAGTGSAAVQAS
jgi:hypothetical protein